nr:hypothetical protein [Tanacetum cinerariifolium]
VKLAPVIQGRARYQALALAAVQRVDWPGRATLPFTLVLTFCAWATGAPSRARLSSSHENFFMRGWRERLLARGYRLRGGEGGGHAKIGGAVGAPRKALGARAAAFALAIGGRLGMVEKPVFAAIGRGREAVVTGAPDARFGRRVEDGLWRFHPRGGPQRVGAGLGREHT